ncbi:hypothetical protein ABZV58_17370 [Nocardia sp. NPDC004654]|uniref:PPE domain-containing protein n=1 Tax=Nocardia sp. NPDC004654 TaxID=3154776 RepID=UPI0033A1623F
MVAFEDWKYAFGVTGIVGDSILDAGKNERDDKNREEQENSKWNQDRQIVGSEWAGLLAEYNNSRFADTVIKVDDPFDTMSHEEIYNALEGVNHSEINSKANGWRDLSRDSRAAVDEFKTAVEKSIEEKWNGKSGTKAIEATRQFATTFTQLAASFQMVAHGLDLIEGHLEQAKSSVGKPDNLTVGDKIIDVLPFQNIVKGPSYRAEEAENQARYVMKTYYMPGAKDVDKNTPILPEPSSTTDGKKDEPVIPGPGPGPGGPGPGPGPGPGGDPGTDDPTDTETPEYPTTDDPQSTTPQSATPTDPTSTTPASTTPAATVPDTKLPNTGLPTPSGPGPGGPGPGVPTIPSPGRSVPGGNLPGQSGPTGGLANSRPAGTGRAGMPGMGAPAARGKGDDDDEHKTPDYLIYDHGDELLGTQPPALPPGGVIGA